MSDAPCIMLVVKPASKKELRKLYKEFGFDQRIRDCVAVAGPTIRHDFCCTTRAIRYYLDETLAEEIASITETVYDHPDGREKATRRTEITRLVIDDVIHQLKHP